MNTITLIIISFIFVINKFQFCNSAKYTVPFPIIHKQSGECLDWYVEPFQVGRSICSDIPDQKWIYHPETGAVRSAFDRYKDGKYNCLHNPYPDVVHPDKNDIGQKVGIWTQTNDCVNWHQSQWIFKSDGHIQTKRDNSIWQNMQSDGPWVIDMALGIQARTWPSGDWQSTQAFQVPAGAFQAVHTDEYCSVSKLDQVAEPKEEDEIAETAWAIGSTVAGMLPVIGGPISVITSFWNPTESDDDGPSAIELVNDVRDEMNQAIDDLAACIGARVDKLALEIAEDAALDQVKNVVTGLSDIADLSGSPHDQTREIEDLFMNFNRKIPGLFDAKPDYAHYLNLLPIYSQLASLWNVVSRQKLLIDSSKKDCWSFNHYFGTTKDQLYKMHDWIKGKAIKTIMAESIQIISDGNGYKEWVEKESKILENKYLAHVENYIESLEDISPNLAMDKSQCTPAPPPNGDITHNFPSPSADNIITVYKYTKNAEWTLSAYQSSQTKSSILTTSRGYTKDIGVIFTLYDEEKDNTLPLYKKYNAESNKYEITTNKDDGNDNDFELVSILGYCSTFQIDPPVSSCGSFS